MADLLTRVSGRIGGAALRVAMPRPRGFWTGIAFGTLSALCAVGLLATSAYLIAAAALQPPILYLQIPIVGVRAFALGRAFFRYLERISSHDAAFRMLATLRTSVFAALIPGAPAALRRRSGGDTVSRLVGDVDELQNLSLRFWQPLLVSGLICLLSVGGIALVSPAAALVLACCLVVAGIAAALFPARLAARAAAHVAPARGRQFELTTQFLGTVDVLLAFDAVDAERERMRAADETLYRSRARVVWGDGLSSAILVLLTGAAVLGSFLATAQDVTDGTMAGALMAMVVLVPMAVFEVFETTPKALLAVQKVRASAERVVELAPDLDSEETSAAVASASAEEEPGRPSSPRFERLELSGVCAGWDPSAPSVRNVDAVLRPGSRVLVTGASGSGKSTLAWTLVRFLPLRGGRIAIDGEDVASWPDEDIRTVIGLCEQTPHVFAGSIRANLHLADPGASDAQMVAVLDRVGLGALLAERTGLDTVVGENGALLSGGQVQRLALARALLGRFPVIVLDEPTANVDPEQRELLMRDLLAATDDEASPPAVLLMSHDDVPPELVDARIVLPCAENAAGPH